MVKIVIDARESGTSTGRYVDKLIEYLYALKPSHDFTILTKKNRVEYFKQISPSFRVEETPYKEFTFAEQTGLLLQINKLKPDLVHFPMVQQPILYRGRTVTTMQDLTTVRFRNPAKNWFIFSLKQMVYKWVNKRVAHKTNVIICPTKFVKEDVAKYTKVNSRNIVVTYESADKITDSPKPIDELVNARFIMYVGRPLPHKNLYRLINAFVILKQDQPKLRLVLVGKSDVLYDKLRDWCDEQEINNIVFTGFVSEGHLKWLYENCAAYVFPSLSEGFGLPGLEAMCHGSPVVSSNATCLPETYGEAAHYFDPMDINDMATKIDEVLKNKTLRTQLINKGTKQVNKYSWSKMAEQTNSVYESVFKT